MREPQQLERHSRAVLDEIEDVLLGDAAAGAGAAHSCEIYIVLAGEFADERGRADVGIFFIVSWWERWRRVRAAEPELPSLRTQERREQEQRPWRVRKRKRHCRRQLRRQRC